MNKKSNENSKHNRLKQLSIFESFCKVSKKRKSAENLLQPFNTKKTISVEKIHTTTYIEKVENKVDNVDLQQDTQKSGGSGENIDFVPESPDRDLDSDCDVICVDDTRPEVKNKTNTKKEVQQTSEVLNETMEDDNSTEKDENGTETTDKQDRVRDDDYHITKKVFCKKQFEVKTTSSSINEGTANERLKDSQERDEHYEAIMNEKDEAIKKFLKTEISYDSDLSQETPKMSSKVADEPTASELPDDYDSLDLCDTFPTQDFDDFPEQRVTWLGKPKNELKVAPRCLPPLPLLVETNEHTVLFDTSYFDIGPPPPSKDLYLDSWDSLHVKLPCSPQSLYPVVVNMSKTLKGRWELIENALCSEITSSHKLESAIKKYNSTFTKPFTALHVFFEKILSPSEKNKFFSDILPKMKNLCLLLPHVITQPVPMLKRQKPHSLSLSQQQIACLLANAFFCTFPRRNSTKPSAEYATFPSINFNRIFTGYNVKSDQSHMEKLRTIFHYFERVTKEMPSGALTFERRSVLDFPVWNQSPCEMTNLHISTEGLIEVDGIGMMQMDFANKYVGGGVLGGGMVQEEILFCIFPELLVSRLFTEVLDDNECLIVTGAERFSNYSGYASTYKWEGDHLDTNSRDSWRRKTTYIVALDATRLNKSLDQYRPGNVRRELNKLYTGFHCHDPDFSPAIATGKWGCGAFGGDPVFKALLQFMVAAVVGRDLCYFTFHDEEIMKTIHEMHEFIKSNNIEVGKLWEIITKYNEEIECNSIGEDIFDFIKHLQNYDASTDEENSEIMFQD